MARWAGCFGKLPHTGDFIVRGIPVGERRWLDRWLSHGLARLGEPDWPAGGWRALVAGAAGPVVALVRPSRDSVGRPYPLAIAAAADECGPGVLEAWCDAAASRGLDRAADDLIAGLAPPEPDGAAALPPLVWRAGERPVVPGPGWPADAAGR